MRRLGEALRRRQRPPTSSPRPAPESPEAVALRPRVQVLEPEPLPILAYSDPNIVSARPVEVFRSLDEARAATAEARHRELIAELRSSQPTGRGSGMGLGLAIGLSIVAVAGLGILLCYVLFRRKDGQLAGPTMPVPMPYPYPVPQLGVHNQALMPNHDPTHVPAPHSHPELSPAAQILQHFKASAKQVGTYMKSFTLPFIGDVKSEPVRIATAGLEPYEVVVRVVEPPGGHAVLSFEPNELNPGPLGSVSTLSTNFSQFPVGDVLVIPSGQFQIMRLRPRQGLFAKGTVDRDGSQGVHGVIVSVTGADFTVGF